MPHRPRRRLCPVSNSSMIFPLPRMTSPPKVEEPANVLIDQPPEKLRN
ncbi:MAG: hypothetical protein LAP21_21385 [Acidobacteriia bacterium]|nr:hypothetical protein [Terriglobia bacterium]